VDWDSLIDERALALLLPAQYAHFARPVKESLAVFLAGLPDAYQTEIFEQQAALGPTATVSERLGRLAQSCPVLHKLGQILARDQRLAPELRTQLQKLESLPPSVPLETIEQILAQELRPLEGRGIVLCPPAIAEASVAVVIPFQRLGDATCQGVFKILKPGIEERLELELELLARVGTHLDERCEELKIPKLDYRDSFEQVRSKLAWEVRLDEEQRHLVKAKEFYAGQSDVLIPALLDFCTPRITAMERVLGTKATDHPLHLAEDKRSLANLVTRALISQPIFAAQSKSLFHCDPHAGNLMLSDDGRLAILDWSLVGWLDEVQRVAISQIMLAAGTLDRGKIIRILIQLSERGRVDLPALGTVVDNWLRRCRWGQFPGMAWFVGLLDEAVQLGNLRVTADLMLFRKSLLTLNGVVAELGVDGFDIDSVLFIDFMRHFGMEWPTRCFRMPFSRECATRISNWDLADMLFAAPKTAARFWIGNLLDSLAEDGGTKSSRSPDKEFA
jgi:ubiquinone biosynthesis protein